MTPHEDGEILWAAVVHVLTPRLLFPDKPPVESDSEKVRRYTGVWVAGIEENTSIAFGYAAESYVDFGVPLMFLPVLAYGFLMGMAYHGLYRLIRHRELAIASVTVIFWLSLYLFERSWANMLGLSLTLIVYLGGVTFLVDRLLRGRAVTLTVPARGRFRGAEPPELTGARRGDMRERLRVLHVTPYFAPAFAYGGPPRSILGLCRGLDRAGVLVQVFTTTANGPATLPASSSAGDRHAGVAVRYFPRAFPRRLFGATGLAPTLEAQIEQYDLVHTHGLWHWPGWTAAHHARRRLIPYVISPRGMLDAGSIAHHTWRKRVAYWMRERHLLEAAALLHATSEAEATTLARRVPSVPVAMLPNGVDTPADGELARGRFRHRLGLAADAPLIVFLGRLHPIKRLDLLAAAFAGVRARHRAARLVIAGPDENGYRGRVEPLFAPVRDAVRLDRRGRRGRQVDAPGGRRRLGAVLGLGELWSERARSDGGGGAGRHDSDVPMGGGRDRRLRILGAP